MKKQGLNIIEEREYQQQVEDILSMDISSYLAILEVPKDSKELRILKAVQKKAPKAKTLKELIAVLSHGQVPRAIVHSFINNAGFEGLPSFYQDALRKGYSGMMEQWEDSEVVHAIEDEEVSFL